MLSHFKLKEHSTDIKTEITAGFTTFLTMLYIVPLNALILSQSGMPYDALVTATIVVTFLITLLNGIYSNTPVALSVGMGLNAYFTYGLVLGMKVPWQSALGVVFISGVLFVLLSFTSFRRTLLNAIPESMRHAISAGIGAFLAFIGLKEIGIIASDKVTLVHLGDLSSPETMLGIFGLVLVIILHSLRIKGAFIISIIATTILSFTTGNATLPDILFALPASIEPIAFKLDILSALTLSMMPIIVAFLLTDMFDTLGTLGAIAQRVHIYKNDNRKLDNTLKSDAIGSVVGSSLGVSTVTSFIESAAGVEAGGRTGLTAVATALFFLPLLFMLPIFEAIPAVAIYPVLVMVGILMFEEIAHINFKDSPTAISAFFTILMIPLTFSITNGIAFGFLSYVLMKIVKKEYSSLNRGLILLALISLIIFWMQ